MKKLVIVILAGLLFFACEEKKDTTPDKAKTVEEPGQKQNAQQEVAMDAVEEGLHIKDAWIRPAGKGRNTGLFFRVVNNTSENDTLLGALSGLANKTEVHETFKEGDMMGMREVDYLVMEAGKVFEFKPMSYHIMLIQLKKDLAHGGEGTVVLKFKNAGDVPVKAKVEDKMPTMKAGEKKNEEM